MPSNILTGCISGSVGAMGVYLLNLVHIYSNYWLFGCLSTQAAFEQHIPLIILPCIGYDDGAALYNIVQHCASLCVTVCDQVLLCYHVLACHHACVFVIK